MTLEATVGLSAGTFVLDVEVAADEGELVVLVGPNGAGKTTLLRALAGLVPLERGRVVLGGTVLEDVAAGVRLPPERRPVGLMFQDHLLFPHLTVTENVAFGLRATGTGRREARRRAIGLLERIGLADVAALRPAALSGGQAQRVALARVAVTEPRLLLLDEPLAALDVTVRGELRRELRSRLAEVPGVRLVVVHDPVDAIALADRIVVIEDGRVVQAGTADDVAAHPRSAYVAELVGLNLFRGVGAGDHVRLDGGGELAAPDAGRGPVCAVVHPHAVALHRRHPEGTPRNVWGGEALGIDIPGDRVRVRVGGDRPVVAEVTAAAAAELRLAEGGEVWASVKATEVTVYPA